MGLFNWDCLVGITIERILQLLSNRSLRPSLATRGNARRPISCFLFIIFIFILFYFQLVSNRSPWQQEAMHVAQWKVQSQQLLFLHLVHFLICSRSAKRSSFSAHFLKCTRYQRWCRSPTMLKVNQISLHPQCSCSREIKDFQELCVSIGSWVESLKVQHG